MASDWKFCKIGDVAKIQGGYAFKSKDFSDTGTPVIKIKNVRKRDIDLTDVARVSQEVAEQASSFLVKSWDVLISMTGSGPNAPASIVGRVARHSGEDDVFLINQRVGRFLIKEKEQLDQRFLYYLFSEDKTQLELLSIATGSANQVNISGKQIESIEVNLPPLSEQKAIAHILGSLDDKIELNRQMNETLEAMAQALFKSWFVDFDPVIDNALAAGNAIPDEFAERAEQRKTIEKKDNADIQKLFPDAFEFTEEMGWIPLGWDVDGFKNIVEKYIDNRGKTPPLSEFGIPLIEVKHISDYEIKPSLDTTKFVDRDTYNSWFRSYLQTDDIIISTVGTIGRICMVANGEEFAIAQNLLGFRFKKTSVLPSFMYYQMDGFRFRHDVDARLVTTVQSSIKRKDLETISLLIPSIKVQKAFEIIVKPLMNKQNSNQNIQLAKLRDILLPKLMSGELRIPDAEVLVENV